MNEIKELISKKNWAFLTKKYSFQEICKSLNFKEVMHLVKHLFYDDMQDDTNQQFALKLILEAKQHFENEWEKDWKNDVFLGQLCSFLWLYDERYVWYKRAYDKLVNPPAELFLLLSGCNSAPGTPPITDDESESYLKKAIEKKIIFESAFKMKNLYEKRGDKVQADYWEQLYEKLKKEGVCSDQLIPDVLNDNV